MKGHLDRSRLQAALELLSGGFEVIAPVARPDDESPPRLESLRLAVGMVTLEPRKPLLPLKTLFLPESEELFRFGRDGAIEAAALPTRDRLVLGALPCDLAALTLLDRVFLADPVDEAYRQRRERTTLVALACPGEGTECFCASAAVNLARPANADAVLAPAPDGFLLEPLTGKGQRVAEVLGDLLREPDAEAPPPIGFPACRADVSMTGLPGWSELWNAALWGELAARCVGCGVCTLTCPTCHCFDVQDERQASGGARLRAWDSCMFCEFTKMASGENPRAAREARVRQRFLHKLAYIGERYNTFGCVGCGRCTRLCPAGIGIEEVIAALHAAGRER